MALAVLSLRSLVRLTMLLSLLAGTGLLVAPRAQAATLSCTPAITSSSPTGPGTQTNSPPAPAAGNPCWTEVTPYPFGSDGNPVDPSSALCVGTVANTFGQYGPLWEGDFNTLGNGLAGQAPCYLQVDSLAFRAWNRGLAAVGPPYSSSGSFGGDIAYGVWLFNGDDWFPDPSFPGSGACPGSTIMWAGKLDYWLVGSSASPQTTLCRFDGVNLEWEPLSLPPATLAKLPLDPSTGKVVAGVGITSGGCSAWNSCWFFGSDGIQVHWDGQTLTDVSSGLGTSPWLDGDFTSAVAGTDASGEPYGLAVSASSTSSYACDYAAVLAAGGVCPTSPTLAPVPPAPDGSQAPQVFASATGPWVSGAYDPPANTDLTLAATNAHADMWVAGDPGVGGLSLGSARTGPAPLEPVTKDGAQVPCQGYGASTFTGQVDAGVGSIGGYAWHGLSVFPSPGASALAGAGYNGGETWSVDTGSATFPVLGVSEPVVVRAVCGQPPSFTQFRRPDPFDADQSTAPLIPVDAGGWVTAVAANASNDAWAATSSGFWGYESDGAGFGGELAPHFYRWTDGQPPNAPAGDDNETRPSLFTLSPPVYQVGAPKVIVKPAKRKTVKKKAKPKKIKLRPAIYSIHSRVGREVRGRFTFYLTFKVRRAVTVKLEASKGSRVVASSGFKHFSGGNGKLVLRLDRKRWPTRLHLVTAKR